MNRIQSTVLASMVLLGGFVSAADFTGSIKMGFFDTKKKEYAKVRISMIQAIKTAKNELNGRVVKAHLEEEDGYLVYDIKMIDPEGKKVKVLVDPVTAKILKTDRDD